jgi:hypothetical protein
MSEQQPLTKDAQKPTVTAMDSKTVAKSEIPAKV